MKNKSALAIFLIIIFTASLLSFILFKPKKLSDHWKTYANKNIGIEFEYPKELQPYALDAISFSEHEEGPGFINIETTYTHATTTEDAIRTIDIGSGKIVKKTAIDGVPALIITTETDEMDETHEHDDRKSEIIYAVHNNRLYKISARWINLEKFLGSIKFSQ